MMIKGLSSPKLVVGFGFPHPGDPSCSLLHTTRSEREGESGENDEKIYFLCHLANVADSDDNNHICFAGASIQWLCWI